MKKLNIFVIIAKTNFFMIERRKFVFLVFHRTKLKNYIKRDEKIFFNLCGFKFFFNEYIVKII